MLDRRTNSTRIAHVMQRTDDRGRALLFSGSIGGSHRAAALEHLSARFSMGTRDVLYVTASTAGRRAAVHDLLAARKVLFGTRVVTLDSLPRELARRARVTPPSPVEPVTSDLLIERAVRHASGSRFPNGVPIAGLASKLATTLEILERNGATCAELAEALGQSNLGTDESELLLHAWKSLELTRPRFGHSTRSILEFARRLLHERADLLAGCDLLVLEDIPLLHRLERELVAALIARAPGTVLAIHSHAPQLPAAPSTRSLSVLRELADWTEFATEPASASFARPIDGLFVAARGGDSGERPAPDIHITRLEAVGDVGEVRLAARIVRRHLDAPPGADGRRIRPSDIAIVVHAGARYRELIHEVFAADGIPVAAPIGRSAAETEIGSVLLRLIELSLDPAQAPRDASLELIRAPHLDVPTTSADRLERRVINEGYLGLAGWDELAMRALGERAVNRVNRLRTAIERANHGFAGIATPEDAARVIRRLARELRLTGNAYFARRRVVRGTDDPALRRLNDLAIREDNEAWEAIEEALDFTVPRLLEIEGSASTRRGTELARLWLTLLRRALDASRITAERPPADAVRVVGTGPGCEHPARVRIVLGLVERIFPRQPRQDPFLSDDIRRAVRASRGWHLGTSDEIVERERECFMRAIAGTTEALYLSSPVAGADGKPAVRSFLIDDLQRTIGTMHPMPVVRADALSAVPHPEEASTFSELLAGAARDVWQHLPRTTESARRRAVAFAAYDALLQQPVDISALTHGRRARQHPKFDRMLFEGLPHATLRLSASQLDALGHCTYRHFVERVLEPQEIAQPEYDALKKGTLVHAILAEWALGHDGWRRGLEAYEEMGGWIRERIDAWSQAERASPAAMHAVSTDLEQLRRLLESELALTSRAGVAKPAHSELAFGEELQGTGLRDPASKLAALDLDVRTSAGQLRACFRGSLDRVDVVEVDGTRYGIVIDYKTGRTSKAHKDGMMKGTDLQLRLYLLALERLWGIVPAGALYLGFGDRVRRGAVRSDLAERIPGIDPKAVELLPLEEWQRFVHEETPALIAPIVERLVTLDITPAPRDLDCRWCQLGPICRYDGFAREAVNV